MPLPCCSRQRRPTTCILNVHIDAVVGEQKLHDRWVREALGAGGVYRQSVGERQVLCRLFLGGWSSSSFESTGFFFISWGLTVIDKYEREERQR